MDRLANPAAGDRARVVVAIACAANFLTILDLWAVSIASAEFVDAFAPTSLRAVSWILNVYSITVAALLVPAGRVADTMGAKRAFLIAMSVFGIASVGCGLAPTLPVLIGWRVLQATAAAVLMPTSLRFVLDAYPGERRRTAVGVWASVAALAASGGPVLGGLLITWSWRWIFLINVPVVVATVLMGRRILPSARRLQQRFVDPITSAILVLAMLLACTALVQIRTWPASIVAIMLGLSTLTTVALLKVMRRSTEPVIPPRLFGHPRYRTGAVSIALYYAGFACILLGLMLLLTESFGHSPLRAALEIAPGPLVSGVVSPCAGRVVRTLGFTITVVAGAAGFAGAGVWLLVPAGDGYATTLLPALVIWGAANGLLQPTLFGTAENADTQLLTSSSAVLTMFRQLGGAVGTAIVVAIAGNVATLDRARLRPAWMVVVISGAAVAVVAAANHGVRAPEAAPVPLRRPDRLSGPIVKDVR